MTNPTVKRTDMGLAGILIVLTQLASSFHTTRNITSELDELKQDLKNTKEFQLKHFAKKEDMRRMSVKLDRVNIQLAKLSRHIRSIKNFAMLEYQNACMDEVKEDDYGLEL